VQAPDKISTEESFVGAFFVGHPEERQQAAHGSAP